MTSATRVHRRSDSDAAKSGLDAVPPSHELRRVLERLLASRRPRASIARLERSPLLYRSSWWIEELRVELADGEVLDVVFKNLGREAPGSRARHVKPAFVVDSRREAWVYRTLLDPHGIEAPVFYGAFERSRRDRWLFLEKVPGLPLFETGEPLAWRGAAAWLARFHARTAVAEVGAKPGRLLQHDAALHERWLRRARSHLAMAGGSGLRGGARAVPRRELPAHLVRAHRAAVRELLALPSAVLHGEYYASNVLVEERNAGWSIRPVDWEMAGVGPPLLDLAALTSGAWSEAKRDGIGLAYRTAALEAGMEVPAPAQFLQLLEGCRLLLAVQWLGWATEWSPPAAHAADWWSEAVRCADRLER